MARSLDQRDREILRALFDHELLLTYQIKVLFFSSLRRCQEVMRELREIGLVDRDLPTERIGVGKAQGHWTITEAGVQVVAVTIKSLGRTLTGCRVTPGTIPTAIVSICLE